MAYFAELNDNNVVLRVLAVSDLNAPDPSPSNSEPLGQQFLASIGLTGRWVQTSYNGTIRRRYAGIGFTYDEERDAFIPPKPSDDAVLDENTCLWVQPAPSE